MHRYPETVVREDLKEKMVFVGGPRQVGKTTMAFHLLGAAKKNPASYLNWDSEAVKRSLLNGALSLPPSPSAKTR